MQITATSGWYGRKKGGLGTDLKPTDFEVLHSTARGAFKQEKQTRAVTNLDEAALERSTQNSIFNSTTFPFTKQQHRQHAFTTESIDTRANLSQRHIYHRTEEYHRPDSRAFLKDPNWPRTDHSPNLTGWLDRRNSPVVSTHPIVSLTFSNVIQRSALKAEETAVQAQAKATELMDKLQLVQLYGDNYGGKYLMSNYSAHLYNMSFLYI